MELKFLIGLGYSLAMQGFNRTFMELKYKSDVVKNNRLIVLIVPLWN